jgi:hypothetical protein
MLQLAVPTTFLIVDSMPLVDLYDMEACWVHYPRKIQGFKIHVAVNQLGLPLRAVVTPGNCYDSPFLPRFIEDLEADYVLEDVGYDLRANKRVVEAIDAEPVNASNPRRGKRKKIKYAKRLKTRWYVVEQFNGYVKDNFLKELWLRLRGSVKMERWL